MRSGGDRLKFEFADGLRAVAALTIAIYHATMFTGLLGDVRRDLPVLGRIAEIGNYAVPVFIVLSGFVLMLPIVRAGGSTIPGGTRRFLMRRARRILPPYYASLLIFLAMIAAIPVMRLPLGTAWDSKIPVTWEGLVSHLLLLHNLSPDWIYQINGPAWSIATEWQIYFLMPLVLLPLWRRIGPWWTTAVSLAFGWLLIRVAPILTSAHYWFIGLFALGMLAAVLAVREIRFPVGPLAASTFACAVVWLYADPVGTENRNYYSEALVGLAVALTLAWLGSASINGRRTWLHRVLEARALVWIGLWSYSLYLMHSPLLALGNLLLLPLSLATWAQLLVMLGVVLPTVLGLSYLFHVVVERRFTTNHQRAQLEEQRPRLKLNAR